MINIESEWSTSTRSFRYLEPIVHKEREIEDDIRKKLQLANQNREVLQAYYVIVNTY